MRKKIMLLSMLATAIALTGAVVPMASAGESAAESLSCAPDYETYPGTLYVRCSYRGTVRGHVFFNAREESELLGADDRKADGKGVVAYLRRTSDGQLLGRLRDATSGNGLVKIVPVAEGTRYTLQMCLDGGICGPRYGGRA